MRAAHRPYPLAPLFTLALVAVFATACRDKRPATGGEAQLVIVKATWGAMHEAQGADVTKVIAAMVKGNALRVEATPQVLGDPADLKIKQLRVQWRKGGAVAEKHVVEGETLVIGANEKPVPIRTVITKAVYGNLESGKTIDVTQKVADLVSNNTLTVVPTNALFGGDPAEVQYKQLRVDYTFDGVPKSKTVYENDTLTIDAKGQ